MLLHTQHFYQTAMQNTSQILNSPTYCISRWVSMPPLSVKIGHDPAGFSKGEGLQTPQLKHYLDEMSDISLS